MSVEDSSLWQAALVNRSSDGWFFLFLFFFVDAVIAFRPWRYVRRSEQMWWVWWAFIASVTFFLAGFLARRHILPGILAYVLSEVVFFLVFFVYSGWRARPERIILVIIYIVIQMFVVFGLV